MSASQPFATAAVDYARRGWRVFKIPPGQKIPKDRWVNGDSRSERASADPRLIEIRAAHFPDYNIGIATGNGLAVLDIDPQNGGKVPAWAPPTLTARTPSGGVHLYYSVDGPVRSSAGALGSGIDVRGDGGMVVAPPSWIDYGPQYNPRELPYEWVGKQGHSFPSLDCLANPNPTRIDASLLQAPAKTGNSRVPIAGTFGEGERHAAMISLAGTMRARGCEEPEIQAALRALNATRFKPPLELEWVDKIARDFVRRYQPDHDLLS